MMESDADCGLLMLSIIASPSIRIDLQTLICYQVDVQHPGYLAPPLLVCVSSWAWLVFVMMTGQDVSTRLGSWLQTAPSPGIDINMWCDVTRGHGDINMWCDVTRGHGDINVWCSTPLS